MRAYISFRKSKGALLASDALLASLAVLLLLHIVSAVLFLFYERSAASVQDWEREALLLSVADRLVKAEAAESEMLPPVVHPNRIDKAKLAAFGAKLARLNVTASLESQRGASGRCIRRIVLVAGELDALIVCG
ncbi:MAG: hypothetical protein QXG98_01220 [Candidatus Micrarchaeia archaeon]